MSNPLPTNPRFSDRSLLWTAIAAAFVARFGLLGAFPLMDPTESRYAEIARQMFVLGDWVTPWIAPGVPFWGKPPLSFWMTRRENSLHTRIVVRFRCAHPRPRAASTQVRDDA